VRCHHDAAAAAFPPPSCRRCATYYVTFNTFDGGDGRKLCQWWTIKTAFNGGGGGGVRWWWQSSMAFNGMVMDYGKAMARQRRLAQLEDERAAQGKATQQPAGVMKGQEGCTTKR
jgi:hypothetical protein